LPPPRCGKIIDAAANGRSRGAAVALRRPPSGGSSGGTRRQAGLPR